MKAKEKIAQRIAREFKDGDLVNLGIGLPTMVGDYIDSDIEVILHSENGFVGLGPSPEKGQEDKDITNAGGQPVTIKKGGAFFDSTTSFLIIRGGHLDATVLGVLQVDQYGNLANWMIPGKMVPGMGGAMDLTVGARKVIVATKHLTKKGQPKILKECRLPLTAKKQVDVSVTELAVIEVIDQDLLLKEVAVGVSVEEVIKKTEAELTISKELKKF
ncbi:MAG: 3-oxoacid CoA-transferase subunit B [Halothermotrichaceae bacterium]